MHFKKIAVGAGVLLGAAAILGSSPAMAVDISSSKNGAVYGYSYGTNTRVAVQDTKADSNSVYVQYGRNAESGRYFLHNKSGSGTTVTSGAGSAIWYIQACISVDWEIDPCDIERTG
ncbi:hypothetical protein [Streptomyces avidinii]|uniref:Lactococcin 972 family bacteriocin n=1 Tax=Streptomyces avidinii TaxID=1895 RepID=A0ABS4LB30_STRAV|nr:hypothetical protein [Streptomyces avidinii]MBP2039299.1 hypothetical protein [Streptomyces avidinii]GGZ30221.1 hypothetical protein GCM10010343_67050 [Streptomyces avidinii]